MQPPTLATTCAWCPDHDPRDPANRGKSHGVCPTCYAAFLDEMAQMPDARAVDRRRRAVEAMLPLAWEYMRASEPSLPALDDLSGSQRDHARAVLLTHLVKPETIRAFARVVGR
jgi:hypothetical protein